MRNISLVVFCLLAASNCGRAPTELTTAMEKQADELRQIRAMHRESVDILFAQIRALQRFILEEQEKQFQQRYAHGPQTVKLADGSDAVIYSDSGGKRFPPLGNPDVDVIAVSTSTLIAEWFSKKRIECDDQLEKAKAEFLKIEDHLEIARRINEAVVEYLDSLVQLGKARKELETALVKKLGAIPGAAALQKTLLQLVVPDTQELQKRLPGEAGK